VKLCVLMPALNEEATIAEVISGIPREIPEITEVVVLVVDDGSTDRTNELASGAGAVVVRHSENKGVGVAFQTGVQEALAMGADIMVSMDSDGQFDPADIPALVAPILRDRAGFVTASRFMRRAFYPKMSLVKFLGNLGMSALVSVLAGRRFYDVSCGFRAYTRDTLMRLNLFGNFTYTQETILEMAFKGVKMAEVPLMIRGVRAHGKSRVASNILYYAVNTSKIILRSFRDFKPMLVFGWMAIVLGAAALGLAGFLLYHYVTTGTLSPHKWAGFTAGYLGGVAFMVFVTGLVADMLLRIRLTQERILYLLKKHHIE
jgi:glycosyltransferase involved in cell wall biosynthesis